MNCASRLGCRQMSTKMPLRESVFLPRCFQDGSVVLGAIFYHKRVGEILFMKTQIGFALIKQASFTEIVVVVVKIVRQLQNEQQSQPVSY